MDKVIQFRTCSKSKKICVFCLITIAGEDYFKKIQKTTLKLLDGFLRLNLNFGVTPAPIFMCKTCADDIQVFFEFKAKHSSKTRKRLANTNEDSKQIICDICNKVMDLKTSKSLQNTDENKRLLDTTQEHITELNLGTLEGKCFCETCYELLHRFQHFLQNCMKVKHLIDKYIQANGRDLWHQVSEVDLPGLQQFALDSSTIKQEQQDNAEHDVKLEDLTLGDTTNVKSEVNHRLEFIDCSRVKEDKCMPVRTEVIDKDKPYQCKICTYKAKFRSSFTRHMLVHQNPSEEKLYNCQSCSFKTRYQCYLKRHELNHLDISKVTLYKCEKCDYTARNKYKVKSHFRVHQTSSELKMHKCQLCTYETYNKSSLKHHQLIHQDTSEAMMYQCEVCDFKTKYKQYLKYHMLVHQDVSKVKAFGCDLCQYKTKYKWDLRKHMLVHANASDVRMYYCDSCQFKTKRKKSLQHHMLLHQSASAVIMYTCTNCEYKTKYKANLQVHLATHQKCEVPVYEYVEVKHEKDLETPSWISGGNNTDVK